MSKAILSSYFGKLSSSEAVTNYTLRNTNGVELQVLDYGGIIRKLSLPNREGNFENCVLGYDTMEEYQTNSPYFGAIVGRFGNRIAHGKFTLEGKQYSLAKNLGAHHLHGGIKGFDKVFWSVKEKKEANAVCLVLSYTSPHLEEGYPGKLMTNVTYRLTDSNSFEVEYRATTDRKTVVSLTQHSYFNLSGNTKNNVFDHELQIAADKILDVDKALIPTGEYCAVDTTPFDFRTAKPIGKELFENHQLLRYGNGYDHCYCFESPSNSLNKVAHLYHQKSGRKMEVFTSAPAMQLYTANHLNAPFIPYGAVCLETQGYPDCPNQPNFPSAVLDAGEEYHSITQFKFSLV